MHPDTAFEYTQGQGFHIEVEPWPEPVNGALLLDELTALLARYVVLPRRAADTLSLWVLHTYAFGLRDVSTYIGIESPEKRCGKTTLLSVLGELVNRPVVAANISSPAFFRVIEETQPTLVIDEADTFLQGNDELRGILNSGYSRKTAFVVRVSNEPRNGELADRDPNATGTRGERGSRLARYSCWCPKVMAAIGRLPDTLADRCIVIRMQRKIAGEQCERLRTLDGTELRRKCARFVQDNAEAIASARPPLPPELNDRLVDIWEPLLVLAQLAGGDWPRKAPEAAIELSASAQESSPIGTLLLDILAIFVQSGEKVFSRTLVEQLNGLGHRPWSEARNGRAISDMWLARQLRPYGLRPRTLRIGDAMAKGYLQEEFLSVCRRYISRAELEEFKAEFRPQPAENVANGAEVQPPLNPASMAPSPKRPTRTCDGSGDGFVTAL